MCDISAHDPIYVYGDVYDDVWVACMTAVGAEVLETRKFRVYVVNALDQSLVKALIQGHALPTAPSSQHEADR